jgi:hypothetical protein
VCNLLHIWCHVCRHICTCCQLTVISNHVQAMELLFSHGGHVSDVIAAGA